jgi:LysM repeat protein
MIIVVAAGLARPGRPAQAATRTAASQSSSTTTQVVVTCTLSAGPAAAGPLSPGPGVRYLVRAGDTLSGIAARFAVPGGWPALYAANRPVIGADPDVLRPGITVVLPGVTVPARYTVAAGDTLSGIAARFAVPGGWPALYAASVSDILCAGAFRCLVPGVYP